MHFAVTAVPLGLIGFEREQEGVKFFPTLEFKKNQNNY